VKAVYAEWERAEKRLAKNLGDTAAEHALNACGSQLAHGCGCLERRHLGDRYAAEGLRPGPPTGGIAQSLVGKRQDEARLPAVAYEALKDVLTLGDATEESKRTGRSR
jgi:hypothetical protein